MDSSYKFDQSLRELISQNLNQHDVSELDRAGLKHAAVAFTLVNAANRPIWATTPHRAEHSDQAAFILTTRAATLSSHAGQRAYPGGRMNQGETVEQAALRELEEEVG